MSPDQQQPIQPGVDGQPVPAGVSVLRLDRLPAPNDQAHAAASQGKAWPGLFILSPQDRKRKPPRLSVWLTALTTVAQVLVRLPASRVVCTLRVDQIRTVAAEAVAHKAATRPLAV